MSAGRGINLQKWSNQILEAEKENCVRFMNERRRYNSAIKFGWSAGEIFKNTKRFKREAKQLKNMMNERSSPFQPCSNQLKDLSIKLVGFPPSPF